FGDMGLLGGALYVALYLLVLWSGYRTLRIRPQPTLEEVIPLVALVGGLALVPITMTSDLWGDLSVTFLFWWAAGASVTLARRAGLPQRSGRHDRRPRSYRGARAATVRRPRHDIREPQPRRFWGLRPRAARRPSVTR